MYRFSFAYNLESPKSYAVAGFVFTRTGFLLDFWEVVGESISSSAILNPR